MKDFSNSELSRFGKAFVFKQENQLKADSNSNILREILEFEIVKCNRNFRVKDFQQYFYFDDTFKKSYGELNKAIDESNFIYLHSYGKNGKSTFIEMFRNSQLIKKNYSTFFYDFRSRSSFSPESDLFVDVESFYWDFLDTFRDSKLKNNPFVLFFDYLIQNFDRSDYNYIQDQYIRRDILQYYSLAKAVISQVNTFTRTENGVDHLDESKFFKILSEVILKEFDFRSLDEKKLIGYILLNILVATKVFYSVKHTTDRKVLFFFDNLDDVHTYLPEEINVSYTANIISFIENISLCYSDLFCENENNTHIDPTFIFVYRTSNYLSTLSAIYEQDDSQRSRVNFFDEDSVRRVRITSVKDSFKIMIRRLDFYRKLCDQYQILYSPKYALIRSIIETFSGLDDGYESKFDPSTILRLWNGNKLSFSKFVTRVEFSENDFNLLLNQNISKRLKSEIFFHYFIKYFKNRSTSYSPFSSFLNYSFSSFNNDLLDRRCSLSRMFFTYVYNRRHEDRKIETVRDAFSKGISLDDFIRDLEKIKINNSNAYLDVDIQTMFEKLFAFEIDNWGNFFSCCASTDSRANSSKEKYKWIDNTIKALHDEKERKNVRFFDNDSAPYFMFKLKRSFEYFSFTSTIGTNTLPSSVGYTILRDGAVVAPYRVILDRVYKRVEQVTEITFEFFEKAFSGVSTDKYCESNWAYNNRMYFDDLISKIIDYLEQIRSAIVNSHIIVSGGFSDMTDEKKSEVLTQINADFASNILGYIHLFFRYYHKLLDRDLNLLGSEMPAKIRHTHRAFKKMKNRAERIIQNPQNYLIEIKA